jgi:hypothetical protein
MRIAFDVDGVVLSSIDVILGHINELTGSLLTSDELTAWDLDPLGIDEETLWKAVAHLYSRPRVEPYAGAADVLTRIHAALNEPLLFITGRHDPDTARRQLEALDWPDGIPDMTVTGGDRDKRRYLKEWAVDLIVEDDTEHFGNYRAQGVGVALMIRPWNRRYSHPVDASFSDWNEVWDWFTGLDRDGRILVSGR